MRTPVLVMLTAALAACARMPTPEATARLAAEAEACRVMAAALPRGAGGLSRFSLDADGAPGPSEWTYVDLTAAEAADLAAGAPAGGPGPVGCDWRALGFDETPTPPRKLHGWRCGASFSRPWISASGRLAMVQTSDGCGPEIGSGEVCLIRKTDNGWAATTECSRWIV